MTNRNVLYRIWNEDGELLYVGATTDPGHRLREHHLQQPWWDEAASVTLQRLATYIELAEAEIEAIRSENPKYNVIHTEKPRVSAMKPRRPQEGGGSVYQRADGLWVGTVEMPMVDGKRRRRTVASKDRAVALRKFHDLKALATLSATVPES